MRHGAGASANPQDQLRPRRGHPSHERRQTPVQQQCSDLGACLRSLAITPVSASVLHEPPEPNRYFENVAPTGRGAAAHRFGRHPPARLEVDQTPGMSGTLESSEVELIAIVQDALMVIPDGRPRTATLKSSAVSVATVTVFLEIASKYRLLRVDSRSR